jgi:hypothetical protein
VHELGHDQPNTTKQLHDISCRHASGQEVVRAVFVLGDRKMVPDSGRAAPSKATCKGTKKGTKGSKKGQKRLPRRVAVTTGDNNDNKEMDDSTEEYVVTTKRDFKRQARQPKNNLEKLLEATCPTHTYPIKHMVKYCTMMKSFMTSGTLSKGRKPNGDPSPPSLGLCMTNLSSGYLTHCS